MEKEILEAFFTETDIQDITPEEFQMAMLKLIEQGLMELIEKPGNEKLYRPTLLLNKIKTHKNSQSKNQN